MYVHGIVSVYGQCHVCGSAVRGIYTRILSSARTIVQCNVMCGVCALALGPPMCMRAAARPPFADAKTNETKLIQLIDLEI